MRASTLASCARELLKETTAELSERDAARAQQREVPRNDHAAHADRLVCREREGAPRFARRLDHFAFSLVGPARLWISTKRCVCVCIRAKKKQSVGEARGLSYVVAVRLDHEADVDFIGDVCRLAVVDRLELGEGVAVALDERGELEEEVAAVATV